jgi:hypothetical protein
VDAIYISKYQNIVKNGRAYSLPGQDPRTSIDFNAARTACEAKGEGWHCITRMEWGLLLRWCQNNGFMPLGNNNYGKHGTESVYKAIPMTWDSSGKILHTATGTGPLSWRHNNEPDGIADLCGNVWEWTGGMRSVYGELQVLANNNGADLDNSQNASSSAWMAINASTGALMTPDGTGTTSGSVKMDYISSKLTYSTTITDSARGEHGCSFANIVCDSTIGDNAKLLLQALGMLQYANSELFASHYNYFNNKESERCFFSGGLYSSSSCGLASFGGYAARSSSSGGIGFRSAFVKLPSA